MENDLRNLILKAQAGDKEAFEALFARFWDMAYYCCFKYLKNEEDAEDATQEVFLVLYRRLGHLKHPRLFAKNVKWVASEVSRAYGKRRRKSTETRIPSTLEELEEQLKEDKEEFLPTELLEKEETRKQLLVLVDQLPRKQREAIILYYFNEFSQKEIAQITKSRLSAVSDRLYNARRTLKTEIEQQLQRERLGAMAALPVGASVSAMPVLSQVFHQEMVTMAVPQLKQAVWQGLSEKLTSTVLAGGAETATAAAARTTASGSTASSAGGAASSSAGSAMSTGLGAPTAATGAFSGLNVAIGTVCVVACLSVTTIGVDLYVEAKGAESPPTHEAVETVVQEVLVDDEPSEAPDLMAAELLALLQEIDTLPEFYDFITAYEFQNCAGVATGENADYVVFNKELDEVTIFAGYALHEGQFRLAWEMGQSGQNPSGDTKNWVLGHLR